MPPTKPRDISLGEVRRRLEYNPETGIFTWRSKPLTGASPVVVGTRAGSENCGDGYRYVGIGSELYAEHRLIWFYVHGVWPAEVDHVNGVPNDNRLVNLRAADRSKNCINTAIRRDNISGAKGVGWHIDGWRARITINRRCVYLGKFSRFEDAVAARVTAEERYHGEYTRKVTP